MKATTTVLAIVMATFLCVSCTSAAEAPRMDKPSEVKAAVPAPEAKAPSPAPEAKKQPTLQELQAQRTMLLLRIEGADSAKQAIEKMIVDAKVVVKDLEVQIEKLSPKKTEPKAEAKPEKK